MKTLNPNKFSFLTYLPVQAVCPEIPGELLHVARETPEGVDLRVEDLQEAAAKVVHPLSVTDLWSDNRR